MKKPIAISLLLAGLVLPGTLFADEVTEEWVARYNGPGNGLDYGRAIAVDSSGNVYVTGKSVGSDTSDDYTTIKYAPDGTELWVARYNSPRDPYSYDTALAIALDDSGNVYVTGLSSGSDTWFDYATVKYDTNGNELWVARYNGSGNSYDCAWAIAVDSSGNVYVTGDSYGGGTSSHDYATVKYDTNGNELWVARYNDPENLYDYGYAIAVDNSGDVYVTGGSGSDYATIKYSQAPQLIPATINIDPDTMNLKSKGKNITCYIELPTEYDINNIDITTVTICGSMSSVLAETSPTEVGDYDSDGIPDLMVTFDRASVYQILSTGYIELEGRGSLATGLYFAGSDIINVIDKGKEHTDETDHSSVEL